MMTLKSKWKILKNCLTETMFKNAPRFLPNQTSALVMTKQCWLRSQNFLTKTMIKDAKIFARTKCIPSAPLAKNSRAQHMTKKISN